MNNCIRINYKRNLVRYPKHYVDINNKWMKVGGIVYGSIIRANEMKLGRHFGGGQS